MTGNQSRIVRALGLVVFAAHATEAYSQSLDFDGIKTGPTAPLLQSIREAAREAVASVKEVGPASPPASVEGGSARSLANAMRLWDPSTMNGLAKLESVAAQDGILDPEEEAFFLTLRLPESLAAYRDGFLAEADRPEGPRSPEIERARRQDPRFDGKVQAIRDNAKPGDLLFWRSASVEPGEDAAFRTLGWWQHAAVMLADGKIMESNRPEGVAIHTVEASVATHALRFKNGEILVARHFDEMTPARLAGLTAAAYRKVGKPWSYMPQWLYGDAKEVSCATAIWELYVENRIPWRGHDGRAYINTIIPLDLIERPAVLVRADGASVSPADDADILRRPHGLVGNAARAADVLADIMPPVLTMVRKKANRSVETWREPSKEPWTP